MKKPTTKDVMEFLRESNAIERVYDEDSLKQAKKAWDFLITCPDITIANILMVHKILMKNTNLKERDKGAFRMQPVWIGGREAIDYRLIEKELSYWVIDARTSIEIPGEDGSNIKIDHVEYEKIHPFIDGNGRTGRMFLNYERLKAGLPILIIHEGEEQMEYYKWFKQHD